MAYQVKDLNLFETKNQIDLLMQFLDNNYKDEEISLDEFIDAYKRVRKYISFILDKGGNLLFISQLPMTRIPREHDLQAITSAAFVASIYEYLSLLDPIQVINTPKLASSSNINARIMSSRIASSLQRPKKHRMHTDCIDSKSTHKSITPMTFSTHSDSPLLFSKEPTLGKECIVTLNNC